MKLPVLSIEGKELRNLEVDDSVFGITPNGPVLHQAYVQQRNNQRGGNVKTKTRGEVQGSTRKIRPQKGTGRARQGSARAPHRVGGGLVFGPRPRDYSQSMPKKMRRLAIRSALSGKVADGQLVIVDQLAFEKPKTKEILRILGNVGFNRSVLVVTAASDRKVQASLRNLDKTMALPAAYLNVADMLNHAGLLITEEAVRIAEGLWGQKERAETTVKPKAERGMVTVEEEPSGVRGGRAARRAAGRAVRTAKAEAATAKDEAEKAEKAKAKALKSGKPEAEAAEGADADKPAKVKAEKPEKAEKPARVEAEAVAEVDAEKPAKMKAEKTGNPAKVEAEAVVEAEVVAAPEVLAEPESAVEAPEAPAEKPKRAPRTKKEAPAAEASAEPATEAKPKKAPRAKKADAKTETLAEEKPKRAPRAKKTEGSE